MSLIIDDGEVALLARKITDLTGETVGEAVASALKSASTGSSGRARRMLFWWRYGRSRASSAAKPARTASPRRQRQVALRRGRAARVIVDTSALLAILCGEPEVDDFAAAIPA
jgi:hypothetical protein